VHTLTVGPLTRDETAEQIELMSAEAAGRRLVDSIYERSEGLPLFTEQLVAEPDPELPELLGEVLERRLSPLEEPAWRVVRTLGTAGRPLSEALLGAVTGLPPADLATSLHDLEGRHLLRLDRTGLVGLRHALLTEAVLRRLTADESADAHRRLASALADTDEPVAAEVAEHWQRAGDAEQELAWRVRAAQEAARRFALVQAATQWRRALELWPDDVEAVGSPAVRRVDAYVAAMDALEATDAAAGTTVAEEALRALDDHTGRDAADTYRKAAGFIEETDEALRLAEQAVAIYEQLPPCPGYVKALATQAYVLDSAGREREATTLATRATEVSAGLGVPALHRTRLAVQASLEPRPDVALAQSRRPPASSSPSPTSPVRCTSRRSTPTCSSPPTPRRVRSPPPRDPCCGPLRERSTTPGHCPPCGATSRWPTAGPARSDAPRSFSTRGRRNRSRS
jgi:hypothetical protein